jgi:hypothetical protein
MGIVYTNNMALCTAYPAVDQGPIQDILIDPSQQSPTYTMASLTGDESTTIIKKLDSLATGFSPQIALMMAEGAYAVIKAVQLVKAQTKQQFRGEFAQGAALDLRFLRPKDIGGTILNPAATALKGLYGGVSAAVYSWFTQGLVAAATNTLVPSQTMELYAAIVYLGFINPIEVPSQEAYQYTLFGVSVPAQSMDFKMIKTFGVNEVPSVKLEKPIIVPPLGVQALSTYSFRNGDDRTQPVAILIARAQELTI